MNFSDSVNGWIGGYYALLKTTDGGEHWQTVQWSWPSGEVMWISTPTPSTIWISSGPSISYLDLSMDGGASWQTHMQSSSYISLYAYNLHYAADSLHLWVTFSALGLPNGGTIFHTANGGKTWFDLSTGTKAGAISYLGLSARNDSVVSFIALAGLPFQLNLLCTTNGGTSWIVNPIPFSARAVSMFSDQGAWIAGDSGKIARTENFGGLWKIQSTGSTVKLAALAAIDSNEAWVVGDSGTVLHTIDGGMKWVPLKSSTSRNLTALNFISRNLGWIVGDSGTILLYHNGVLSGIREVHSARNPSGWYLQQNYPNPFNPATTIRYALPSRTHVTLTVFNTLGQAVATLVDEVEGAGYHDVRFDGTGLASGVYFYRLRAGEYVATKRLLLVR